MIKACNCCNTGWKDVSAFLDDVTVRLMGVQLNTARPDLGCMFLFDHTSCGTTLALKSDVFRDMISEPIPLAAMYGEEFCPRYCLDLKNFLECKNECRNAPFRRLAIRILQQRN